MSIIYNQEEAGAQGLRPQRLMVIEGTQKLDFCFFIRIAIGLGWYLRAVFHGFSVVCPTPYAPI